MVPAMEMPMPARQTKPLLIKRYARSRLYDAANRRYVSLEQLRDWAAKGVAFGVQDTETGADVTRVLLA
jgi:polyhydroxyalkanoate synthesis regulator protein